MSKISEQHIFRPLTDLTLGFNDAENYRRREEKELFNQIFIKTDALVKLKKSSTFFLIGEKGTGKTANAMFLVNNGDQGTKYFISFLRDAGYEKFITLKKKNELELSEYKDIWKTIIYLLLSDLIRKKENNLISKFLKFKAINFAIDDFYENAFAPEILTSIRFVENTKLSAELIAKFAVSSSSVGNTDNFQTEFSENKYQINLLYIQRQFEEALSSLKLESNYVLFIDGIDIRPSTIDYEDYLACLRGLANAVWEVNNDFLSNIKDSRGRMRVILSVRPDIFDTIGLPNQSTKLQNNSVILDWLTTYKDYRNSGLFKIADRMLGWQQDRSIQEGDAWDHYFPFKIVNKWTGKSDDDPFIIFLRLSLYRPRDINTMLMILIELIDSDESGDGQKNIFTVDDINDKRFLEKYSNYLLGEIKDQLSFYYSREDYEVFREFFDYLNGKVNFTYEDFIEAYNEFFNNLINGERKIPDFMEKPNKFLQLLYELNILSYRERPDDENDRSSFIHWCFRERSVTNPAPKIKPNLDYSIHYGFVNALNLGKPIKNLKIKSKSNQ